MNFNEVLRIAQAAWDKTKSPSDPVWNEANAHHRQVFAEKARAVIDTNHAVDDFEATVKRLAQEAEQRQAVIEEVAADSPGAHSDEIQLEAARRARQLPAVSEYETREDRTYKMIAESERTGENFFPGTPTPADVLVESPKSKRSHSKAKPKGEAGKKSSKKR